MRSKTRLSSYCTKRGDNTMNLVTSRKTNARLARPIIHSSEGTIQMADLLQTNNNKTSDVNLLKII